MSDQDRIYVRFRGRTLGPLTSQKVKDLVRRGQITRMHELSGDGLSWTKAEQFGDYFSTPSVAVVPEESTTEPAAEESIDPAPAATHVKKTKEPEEWYVHLDGESQGPVSLVQVRHWKSSGMIHGHTLVWRAGLDSWQAADQAIPELFPQDFPRQSDRMLASSGNTRGESGEWISLARELDRRRGWTFFFAVVLVVLSSLQILGQLIAIFVAASEDDGAVEALVGGFVGIGFAGTVMTAGILLLQYCAELKHFAMNSTQASALVMAKRHSSFWGFVGVASLIWLVIFVSVVLVLVSIGLSAIDALS